MHPSEELLLAVASGEADLPYRVLVEGHLDACAACRATLGEISAPGGALLSELRPEQPPDIVWQSLRTRIAALPPKPQSPPFAGIPLPEAARRELPDLDEVRWMRLPIRGARLAVLIRDPFTGSVLILGHMPPRRFFPEHLHQGPEDVLVLAGGYADRFGTYEAGVFASYAPGTRHRPLTEPDEECWILTRLEKPNLFLGWRGWVQRLFF
ncbi:MAG TPA: cupin domain-containing protein [Thermoanaerobaculia bacterium]|nr:cupin domain-containing protein [Thermoanaerobaculia bacterium]